MNSKNKYKIITITLLLVFTIGLGNNLFYRSYLKLSRSLIAAPKKKTKTKRKRGPRYFSLNFKDVEIQEFLKMMSGLIKKNIILDDKVRGKITINSAKKVPVSQAFEIMKSVLELKGLAVIETKNLIKVVPIKDAIKKNIEIIVDNQKIDLKQEKTITYLLNLKYADVNEIYRTLNSLKSRNTTMVVYPALDTIIFSGGSTEVKGLIRIARQLDKSLEDDPEPKDEKGFIHVVHLQNSKAEDLANVLSRIPFSETTLTDKRAPQKKIRSSKKSRRITSRQAPGYRSGNQNKQKLTIIANKETNSLIITAKPAEFREIKKIIKQLDIVREQVLIEALIVEVSADNNWSFGIDWMLGAQTGKHIGATSQIHNAGNLSGFGDSPISGKTLPLPVSPGFQLGYLSDRSILSFAILNASAVDGDINILSTPQILTIDNEEAELNVGKEIAIPSQSITGSGTQNLSYEYKPVGIKLKITPHITKSDQITLDLYQEVNSVLGQFDPSTGRPPDLGKRDIKTRITVYDGKTVVVGGLISKRRSVKINKVPLLGDIPLLGWIFKRQSIENERTNLMVFITPHIVTKIEKLEAMTRQKQAQQKMLRQRK